MAKRKDSKYLPGRRSDLWLKIKVRQTAECVLIGYTPGKGNRSLTFGSLQIAEKVNGELHYRGKVGTGFDDSMMKEVLAELKKQKPTKKPSLKGGKIVDEKVTEWLNPKLVAEVSYSMLTSEKMFREPVFLRLRPDLI